MPRLAPPADAADADATDDDAADNDAEGDGDGDDADAESCPGVKSRAMDRCFCWITTARGLNQLF